MTSDRRVCSDCVHAALDSGGVYCKLFHEQILTETVAEECGEYEPDTWSPEPAAKRPVLVSVNGNGWHPEQERKVCVQVVVEYFGREENGDKIVENLGRQLALHYGERVRMKRL
jgi:hypothetical protein